MNTSPKVVFFGNEQLATGVTTELPILHSLLENGYNIAAIVINRHQTTSRHKQASPVEEFAQTHQIPLLSPQRPMDILGDLQALQADCGILAAYGRIVSQALIDIFPRGIVNLHPSLLPHHRGPTPLEQTILDGDSETGISLMALALEMDAGPVYYQEKISLQGNENKQLLADTLGRLGAQAFIDHLPAILAQQLEPTPQDHSQATYCQLLSKDNGLLQPADKTADQLSREVRAFLGWPKSRLTLYQQNIIVTAAHPVTTQDQASLTITCARDTHLTIDQLIAPSGKSMSGEAFLRGYASKKPL